MDASHRRPSKRPGPTTVALPALWLTLMLSGCSGDGTPDALPSVTPSPASTPTAVASPSAPPHQIVSGVDVAVLERLESPTTGETWHEPREIENLGLFTYSDSGVEDTYRYFEVGNLGSARLIVATTEYFEVFTGGYAVYAMFAVTDGGAAMITCPSARGGDSCLDWSSDWE